MKITGKTLLILAIAIVTFIFVSGTCVSSEQDNLDKSNSQVTGNSSILSSIIKSFESLFYTEENKNITKWIDILEDSSVSDRNREDAAYKLGETGNNRAAKPLGIVLLNTEESESLRSTAAKNLGKVGNEKDTDLLIRMLDDEDLGVAISSAISLGYTGNPKAVEPLMKIVDDTNISVTFRMYAIISLGEIGDERATELLIYTLKDSEESLASEAATSLGEIGDERAVEPLINSLEDERYLVIYKASQALETMNVSITDILIDNLNSRNTDARKNAAILLGEMKTKNATSKLLEIVENRAEEPEVRAAAVNALEHAKDNSTIKPLIRILNDTEEPRAVRINIPSALRRIDENAAINPLLDNLNDTDAEVRINVMASLERISSERAIKPIEYLLLNDEKWRVRRNAAITLGRISGSNSTDAYILALNDESTVVRSAAASQLRTYPDKNATEALISALENETDQSTRNTMVQALDQINDEKAILTLIQIAEDENEYINVQISAVSGLGNFRNSNTTELLIWILENTDNSPYIRSAAADALGKVNDTEAIEVLIKVAEDEREFIPVRESAQQALDNIGLNNSGIVYTSNIVEMGFDFSSIADFFKSFVHINRNDNVSQWIEILEDKSQSEDKRGRAARKLGESGDSRAVKPFLKIMEDTGESAQMREYATVNLGKVGSKKHTNMLIGMLDEDPLRAGAAIALGDLGDKKAVEPLMNILANESQPEYMREHSAKSLGQIGDERAVELLIECLEKGPWQIQPESAWSLGEIGDKRAIEPLTNHLDDEHEFTVKNSAVALQKLGVPVEEMLIENLDHRDATVRINSIQALRSIEGADVYDIFLSIAQDRTEEDMVRRVAIGALGKSGNKNAIEPLVHILENENERKDVRKRVPWALMNINEGTAIKILLEELDIENMEVRSSIVSSFRGTEEEKQNLSIAIEPLVYLLLNDKDWPVRKQAAIALGDIAGENASDALALALSDDNSEVRSVAAKYLSSMSDANSTEYLINAQVNETNKYTRSDISRALAHTNDIRAVPVLIQLMQDKNEYINVRISSAEGLGTMTNKDATEPLMQALENKEDSPDIRNVAAVSLGQIGDSAAIKLLTEIAADEDEHPAIRQSAEQSLEMIQEANAS
ncbi:HEAT repeat domain-containing protein [uncultured Methanolobus sp.]|uniref:HEAT repeat domain-containing protein n=1 Tax=uncultured Methanolobus sp. TaxID=218300 RepID=UPI002AAAC13C|nr:HEAT repeat domain-containing protein [uncultured Methanolobus sp.]